MGRLVEQAQGVASVAGQGQPHVALVLVTRPAPGLQHAVGLDVQRRLPAHRALVVDVQDSAHVQVAAGDRATVLWSVAQPGRCSYGAPQAVGE